MPNVRITNSIDQIVTVSLKPPGGYPVEEYQLRPGDVLPSAEFPADIPEVNLTPYTRELARKGYIEITHPQVVTVSFVESASDALVGSGAQTIGVKAETSDGLPLAESASVEVADAGTGTGIAGVDYEYDPDPQSVTFNPNDESGTVKIVNINVLAPHPAAGTGGTWFDVQTTAIWDDEDATDPAELTEGEALRRVDVNEAHQDAAYLDDTSDHMFYSPVTHATPNGRPSVYCADLGLGTYLGLYRNAAKSNILASGELTGRPFGRILVAKRLSTTTNREVCGTGSNRPMQSRTDSASEISVYGFVSGFVASPTVTWNNGAWAVIAYRWVESTSELEISINGGAWQATSGGDTGWSPDTGLIFIGGSAKAVAFDWYFDGNPDSLSGYADMDAFIAALKTHYGIA